MRFPESANATTMELTAFFNVGICSFPILYRQRPVNRNYNKLVISHWIFKENTFFEKESNTLK